MGHFIGIALAFPAVVFTVLLGVSLVYWLFVIVGAAHVNILGEGAADGAVDAAADAAVDAALDGVAKGALEGATKGMLEGLAEHAHADGGADGDVGEAGEGVGGVLAALKLRSAPATVVLSILILFSWFLAVAVLQALDSVITAGGLLATVLKLGVLLLTPIIALFPTSLVVRPLAKVFTPHSATKHEALVGKLCTIRTGTVTERFGEATLEEGGAAVVVRVRVEETEESKLGRGDQAVIVGYDPERQEFTVAPMENLLEDRSRRTRS